MTDHSMPEAREAPDHYQACRAVMAPMFDDLLVRAGSSGWPRDIVLDVLRDLIREKAQQDDHAEALPVVGDFPID